MALSEESFLPDAEDCAETWRALRWPEGPECVECGSSDVAVQDWDYLSRLRRYKCRECGRWFNDRSETFLESSKVRLPKWIYVLREMDKGRSINSIAEDLPHRYKTVHGMATTIREAIYQPSTKGVRSGARFSPERSRLTTSILPSASKVEGSALRRGTVPKTGTVPKAMNLRAIALHRRALASPEREGFLSGDEEVGRPIARLRCCG